MAPAARSIRFANRLRARPCLAVIGDPPRLRFPDYSPHGRSPPRVLDGIADFGSTPRHILSPSWIRRLNPADP